MILLKKLSPRFLLVAAATLTAISFPCSESVHAYGDSIVLPMTGKSLPCMNKFDQEFLAFIQEWKVPGAAISIVKNGNLIFSRGYGFADFDKREAVQPDSLFRIASVSKLYTAAAILKLVEDGKLSLDSKAFEILDIPKEQHPARKPDPRIFKITIKQLLEGTAGWDRRLTGDPMFSPLVQQAALDYSNSLRPTARAIIRYQYSRPLDFTPGTRFAYSNLEYSILGEVIAKVSGKKYSQYVSESILQPMGLTHTVPGRTRIMADGEVCYYGHPNEGMAPSLLPNVKGDVPQEYGGHFYLEALTADCGWVSSTSDVAMFASNELDQGKRAPLSPKTVSMMIARPSLSDWQGEDRYFGMGWEIEGANNKNTFLEKKEGCMPGSTFLVFHCSDGYTLAVGYNSRPESSEKFQNASFELMQSALKDLRQGLKVNAQNRSNPGKKSN